MYGICGTPYPLHSTDMHDDIYFECMESQYRGKKKKNFNFKIMFHKVDLNLSLLIYKFGANYMHCAKKKIL